MDIMGPWRPKRRLLQIWYNLETILSVDFQTTYLYTLAHMLSSKYIYIQIN